jgi:urease accessory protein
VTRQISTRLGDFVMEKRIRAVGLFLASIPLLIDPALAHHVMGGRMPVTFADGLLSGLGHPIIGLDHFAAIVAVACLAAAHRAGPSLVVGFVVAMIAGVAVHVRGTTMPAAEMMVALSVVLLGVVLLRDRSLRTGVALGLFIAVGLVHGYALGESIYGSEASFLIAYFIGLAAIQSAVALAVMFAARAVLRRQPDILTLRLVGAGIVGIGLTMLMQQVIPAP